jgi:uncharacterized protein YodC (DUF2158 family)
MTAIHSCLFSALLLSASPCAWTQAVGNPADAEFQNRWGGYLLSTAFRVDAKRPQVIFPPATLREGDELWIQPLRLYSDDYLVLQRCLDAACSKTEVVRAWNAYGFMGPYPVLSHTVQVKSGGPYMLWMQHVKGQGMNAFGLYERDAPPLVFEPAGMRVDYNQAQLKAARAHGPELIKKAAPEKSMFVVTFESGSIVQMQALRAPPP